MSFPPSLATRTVKGRFVTYPEGVAAKGTVRIVLSQYMQGPTDDAFVAPFDITLPLDVNGEFSVTLPSNNDPQWTPAIYRVIVNVDGKILRSEFNVPYNETGPIDLVDMLNVPDVTPGIAYVIAASKGAPGGVASLGEDGKVPSSQLPSFSVEDVNWDDVQGKPSTFPPSTHSHDFSSITAKPSTYPPSTHSHSMVDVTGLSSELANKAAVSHTHPANQITGLSTVAVTGSYNDLSDKPAPGVSQSQVDLSIAARLNLMTTGEELMARETVTGAPQTDLGALHLTFFTARKSEAITRVATATGATAFSGTRSQVAIYSVSSDDSVLTLITNTADAATLWNSAYTEYDTALVATFNKVAGSRYAVGFLSVGTAAPSCPAQVISYFAAMHPRIVGWLQTSTIPSSIVSNELNTDWRRFQAVLLPAS